MKLVGVLGFLRNVESDLEPRPARQILSGQIDQTCNPFDALVAAAHVKGACERLLLGRSTGSLRVERLNRSLLIHAEHRGMLGIEIESDDIGSFGLEFGIDVRLNQRLCRPIQDQCVHGKF